MGLISWLCSDWSLGFVGFCWLWYGFELCGG